MHIFVTDASVHIGPTVIPEPLGARHQVVATDHVTASPKKALPR